MQADANWVRLRASSASPSRPWLQTRWALAGIDLATWVAATLLAFALHGDGLAAGARWPVVWSTVAAMSLLKLAFAQAVRLHAQEWRRFGFRDAANVLLASLAVTVVAASLLLSVGTGFGVPLAVPVIDGILTAVLMFSTRGSVRFQSERRLMRQASRRQSRVLLIGAGDAGSMLAREMLRHPETGMRPVGFIDEDPAKQGLTIASVPVLGRLDDLGRVVGTVTVDEILIAIPSADGPGIRRIVDTIRDVDPDMPYRTMPALHELLSGRVTVSRIRDVGIEDLLRRPPVELDSQSILSYLSGKRVMVTGAGGSIGSELVRQICRFSPGELILFGHGENSIFQLERELDLHHPDVTYRSVIAAVQNVQRLDFVFRRYRPDVVFHAAAHKHVPLMELNPEEAIFNNVIGTRNLVQLALKYGVTHFVNVSTDKAVNPSSVMGASKRMAELIVEDAATEASDGQAFVSVRFGNVLGSRGSAVPTFKSQILNGGPVTVTHPDMMRYFMTIPEASQLVLQASALGKNGEIYILDMGEPVRVLDLVKDLIRLSGLEPGVDIPIVFTGIRPGEKLFEELMTDEEKRNRTRHEHIVVAQSATMPAEQLDGLVERLVAAAMNSDGDEIRRAFAAGIGALDARAVGPAGADDAAGAPESEDAPMSRTK